MRYKVKRYGVVLLMLMCVCAFASGNSHIRVYFTRPVNTSVSTGQQAVFLNQTADDTLIAYINRAKYSLDIAVYNYVQGAGISSISTAINNAYSRGVKIRWIYDGSSSNTGLTQLNGSIHTLASPTTSTYGIMHNKFMIVDANSPDAGDPLVWTGSCNWDVEQVDSDYNNIIIIQDRNLALAYTTEFNQMWGDTGLIPNTSNSKFGPKKSDITPHLFNVGGTNIECYFSPSDNTNAHIQAAIGSANSQLFFGVYTFTLASNADSIINRINAGVYAAGIIDQFSINYQAYSALYPIMGSRVKVYNQSNSIYHNKFLIVDPCDLASDPLVETGSHNWSNAADTKNDENTLVIHDATIANLYYQSFAQNFADLNGVLSDCQILNDITDAESGNAIKLYPNPSTNGQWLVETPAEWLGAEAEIFDSNGRMVYRKTTNELKTSIQADIAKGVYIFKLTLQGNVFVQKVVKL